MSLISLLIALAAERSLSSSVWHFSSYYQRYVNFFKNNSRLKSLKNSTLSYVAFILLPVAAVYVLLHLVDDGLVNLIISTLILIICFGCCDTRAIFKQYIHAANHGETTTSQLHHQQLLQDKNLPQMGFGQALIWLNYRYYIAIILFFTVFGATGAVFYRLLTTVIEQKNKKPINTNKASEEDSTAETNDETEKTQHSEAAETEAHVTPSATEEYSTPNLSSGCNSHQDIIFWLDWLPVRITSFGYMFVGHFSKAFPVWLENLFDANKPAYQLLADVAEKSEDIDVDADSCTSEPCLLVKLAKRNLLLILASIAFLTMAGVIS